MIVPRRRVEERESETPIRTETDQKKDEIIMTGKSNDNSVEDFATSESDAENSERSLGYRTRVATVVVSVVVMLFCAVFWQSVLDFKSKLERNPSLEEFASESYDEPEESDDVVEQTDDWREQLAALYPREEFESDAPQSEVRSTVASDDPASRFNDFVLDFSNSDASDSEPLPVESSSVDDDDAPLPPAPSVARNVRDEVLGLESSSDVASPGESAELEDDDAALVAAAQFDVENPALDDEPLPVAPRTKRSAYAADEDSPAVETNAAPEESAILAELPTVDPSDPLGLESASSLESETELPPAPGTSRASEVSDAKSRVAFAGYSALAESSVAPPPVAADETLGDSSPTVVDETAAVAVAETSAAPVDPAPDDAVSAPEPASGADESPVRLSKAELAAVADAVFAPSYFSRAVGLFGGQDAFSALYFARAARIVSDSASWTPDSWSRVAPIAVSGAPTPKKSQSASASSGEGTTEPDDASDGEAPVDDATAAAIHAKYPTLVGYIERRSIKSPAPLSTVEPNQSATPALPAAASGALQ